MVKNLPPVPSGIAGSMVESPSGLTWRERYPVINGDCNLCLECTLFCPEGALAQEKENLNVTLKVCKGCGICAVECKQKAVTMEPEFNGVPGIFPAKGGK